MADTPTERLAQQYDCSLRTVFRMKAAGINIADPIAVSAHVALLKRPSPRMVKRLLYTLETLETTSP